MTTSHVLLFVLALSAICSNLTHASAVQPHTYSPSPSPSMAPSPSPSQHHHHHHNHSHHNHTHHHHATSPSPAHSSVIPPTHSPAHSPAMPPALAPSPYSKPPTKAPSPSPSPSPHSSHTMPPRKLVAVEGVVYCKNCSYSGVDTLMGASPLPGAMVELRCRNTKYMIKKTSTTDKNGFFFLQAPKHITTYGAHKCLVFLVNNTSSTTANANGGTHRCSNATNLNNGVSGAFLFLDKNKAPPSKPLPYSVYSVGPFAFEPPKCYKH